MSSPYDETVTFHSEAEFRSRVSKQFAASKQELETLVPGADVQHVGSTAVPGSLTKGDLDIQVRVTLDQYAAAKQRFSQLYALNETGFVADDAASFEDHRVYPHIGIHLTVKGGTFDVQTRFRDRLLGCPQLMHEYDNLKKKFEGKSMDAYRAAKTRFR